MDFASRGPPPPVSPVLPYTTLFRSPGRTGEGGLPGLHDDADAGDAGLSGAAAAVAVQVAAHAAYHRAGELEAVHRRSEEHTSELQSRRDLVCRLLLEKKKDGRGNRG